MIRTTVTFVAALLLAPPAVDAQVDQQLAASFFKEAQARCEADGGKLWGISLCGPMVVADPVTRTLATTQPAPSAPWPPTSCSTASSRS